jgi:hypothetical protein
MISVDAMLRQGLPLKKIPAVVAALVLAYYL